MNTYISKIHLKIVKNNEYININIYICKYYVPTMALRLPPSTSQVVICSDSLEISPTSCAIINVNLKLINIIYIIT